MIIFFWSFWRLCETIEGEHTEGGTAIKIYTGTGDFGKTSLFSGERVEKSHPRVEACGEVDELNASLGLLVSSLREEEKELAQEVEQIQSALFDVGAMLSSSTESLLFRSLRHIREEDIKALERNIDRMDEQLPPLTGFILPGGHPCSALSHVARAVCRRAERRIAILVREGNKEIGPVLIYLNRLSDYLFVLARHLNRVKGVSDIPRKRP